MKSDPHKILHEVLWSAHAPLALLLKVAPLPLRCESNHLARLFNFSEQFPNSFLLAWQQQVRPDIGEGSKDKLS